MLIRIVIILLLPSIVLAIVPWTFEISPYGLVEYPSTIKGFDGRNFEQSLMANIVSINYVGERKIVDTYFKMEYSSLTLGDISKLLHLAKAEYSDKITVDDLYFSESSLWLSLGLAVYFNTTEPIIIPVRFNMEFGSPIYSISYKLGDETVDVLDGYTYHRAISLSVGIRLNWFDLLTLELGQRGSLGLFEGDHALPAYAELTLFDTGGWFGGIKLYGEYDWLDNWTKFKATASLVIRLLPLESEE